MWIINNKKKNIKCITYKTQKMKITAKDEYQPTKKKKKMKYQCFESIEVGFAR